MKRILYLFFFLIAASACKEVYEAPPQALVGASFLNAESETDVAMYSNITVWGIGQERAWVKDTLLQKIILPLSPDTITKYLISFDSIVDTVIFTHETFKKYDSMETGFYYDFKIKTIESTHKRIDFILIIDSLVTKDWHENIKFYLRTLPAGSN
jgi:hypothetical protein